MLSRSSTCRCCSHGDAASIRASRRRASQRSAPAVSTMPQARQHGTLTMSDLLFHMIGGAPDPVAPFSHAVEADGWVFVTGQMPFTTVSNTSAYPESIEDQTRQVMKNLVAVLNGCGLTLANVVAARVFLVHFDEDYERMNAVYATYFDPDDSRANVHRRHRPRAGRARRDRHDCAPRRLMPGQQPGDDGRGTPIKPARGRNAGAPMTGSSQAAPRRPLCGRRPSSNVLPKRCRPSTGPYRIAGFGGSSIGQAALVAPRPPRT